MRTYVFWMDKAESVCFDRAGKASENYLSTPQLDTPSLLAPRHSLIAQLDATLFTRRGAQVGLTTAPAAAAAHTVRSMTLRT